MRGSNPRMILRVKPHLCDFIYLNFFQWMNFLGLQIGTKLWQPVFRGAWRSWSDQVEEFGGKGAGARFDLLQHSLMIAHRFVFQHLMGQAELLGRPDVTFVHSAVDLLVFRIAVRVGHLENENGNTEWAR